MADAEKHKHQHTLPNRQLAQVFNFSAADLAANRTGYITHSQMWAIPLWMRQFLPRLRALPLFAGLSQRRKTADHLCGRAVLTYEQQQIQSIFHADIVEVYRLSINTLTFRISPQQYQALGEGLVYHVYYDPDNKHILSLERAINGC